MAKIIVKAPFYKPGHKTEKGQSRGGYARVYPDLCRQIDDNETGGLSFEIQKDRFSFRLLPPCSDERKEKARACAEALNQSRKEL